MQHRFVLPALAVCCCLAAPLAPQAQESATYVMDRVTQTTGASEISSTSYDNMLVIAQLAPAESASICNTGSIVNVGFMSIFGDLPVPIVLNLSPNSLDPADLDLRWSGSASDFVVFRATTPDNIQNPANLILSTDQCDALDLLATPPGLVIYYNVVPTTTP